jgi:hypothetical protein
MVKSIIYGQNRSLQHLSSDEEILWFGAKVLLAQRFGTKFEKGAENPLHEKFNGR